jgi:hypothetical protein
MRGRHATHGSFLKMRIYSLLQIAQVCSLVYFCLIIGVSGQEQDPLTLNGGSVLAMAGNECVALAVDKRFGSGPQVGTGFV